MTELIQTGLAVAESKLAGVAKVIGDVVGEDLHRTFDAGTRGDRGLCGATEVRIVEVHEPVRGCTNLPALPELFPCLDGAVGAHQHEHCADGFSVANDDAVNSTDLTRFGLYAEPAGSTDKRHCAFVAGAGDFERG
jgi:hypothetical protein